MKPGDFNLLLFLKTFGRFENVGNWLTLPAATMPSTVSGETPCWAKTSKGFVTAFPLCFIN